MVNPISYLKIDSSVPKQQVISNGSLANVRFQDEGDIRNGPIVTRQGFRTNSILYGLNFGAD